MKVKEVKPLVLWEIDNIVGEIPDMDKDYPEEWRYLKNDGRSKYLVSNYGRVYDKNGKYLVEILTDIFHVIGPAKVVLMTIGGCNGGYMVDLIVANAFVEKPDPKYQNIVHIDGDSLNCKANNLKWVS